MKSALNRPWSPAHPPPSPDRAEAKLISPSLHPENTMTPIIPTAVQTVQTDKFAAAPAKHLNSGNSGNSKISRELSKLGNNMPKYAKLAAIFSETMTRTRPDTRGHFFR